METNQYRSSRLSPNFTSTGSRSLANDYLSPVNETKTSGRNQTSGNKYDDNIYDNPLRSKERKLDEQFKNLIDTSNRSKEYIENIQKTAF